MSIIKKIIKALLIFLAKKRIKKSSLKIIGITGTYGKTSLKDALAGLLKQKYLVLKSEGNLNTEYGLILTIFGIKTAPKNLLNWGKTILLIFYRYFFSKLTFDYAVFEYGVDKPGDMEILTKIAPPDIAVFTQISHGHLEETQFSSPNEIWQEKRKLALSLRKNGFVIYNADDSLQEKFFKNFHIRKSLSYSLENKKADIYANNIESGFGGLRISALYKEEKFAIFLKNLFLRNQAIIVFVCVILGKLLHIPVTEIQKYLINFSLPKGRMNLLEGINNSIIIDSSYNACPATMQQALEFLATFSNKRKIAALGQMNELGAYSKAAHEKIGKIAGAKVQVLITVGPLAKTYIDAALKINPKIICKNFSSSFSAGNYLKKIIKNNDIILVKGSQNNVFMENLIKEIMADPKKANSLLVRQY